MSRYWCRYAWLPTGPAPDVLVEVDDGRFSVVQAGVSRAPQRVAHRNSREFACELHEAWREPLLTD